MGSIFKGNKYITTESVKESLLMDSDKHSLNTRILANVAVAGKLALEAEYQNDEIKREYVAIILYVFERIGVLDDDMGGVFSSAVRSFCSTDNISFEIGRRSIENIMPAYNDISLYMSEFNAEYSKGLHEIKIEMKGEDVDGGTETKRSETGSEHD